ncbi:hypothetical protein RGU70_11865 [Herbaspirillum sp. RTI4]|uniref:hypothetical protein n=1 Tax=Herbaspirillum sp. RTI4 TaxID=3048640 RepID=UPI002AB574C1|nr:hypothetical protein [Herbaspirillum sp. RTI4]MDY7579018.1 hypothetical protein [Herbaspirillum sp. RTI4]MEA9980949.1 hypothetical protein [Herbaspirillum sp. RTI4]
MEVETFLHRGGKLTVLDVSTAPNRVRVPLDHPVSDILNAQNQEVFRNTDGSYDLAGYERYVIFYKAYREFCIGQLSPQNSPSAPNMLTGWKWPKVDPQTGKPALNTPILTHQNPSDTLWDIKQSGVRQTFLFADGTLDAERFTDCVDLFEQFSEDYFSLYRGSRTMKATTSALTANVPPVLSRCLQRCWSAMNCFEDCLGDHRAKPLPMTEAKSEQKGNQATLPMSIATTRSANPLAGIAEHAHPWRVLTP